MSDPFAEYRKLLERYRELIEGRVEGVTKARPQVGAFVRRALYRIGQVALVLILPFFVLVFSSVFVYRNYSVPTWPALLVGVLLTALLLLVYAAWLTKRLSGTVRVPTHTVKTVAAVVGAYCLYALIYLSSMNVKDPEIRGHYRSMHPLLRVATSTLILVDRDLVITDMWREPEDYARMGLPLYEGTLHFKQADGYAHAVDLRTLGHSKVRNFLMRGYFGLMGFRTLRHVGTADHLHVSLPIS